MKIQAPSWFVYQPLWATPDNYYFALGLLCMLMLAAALALWAALRRSPAARVILVALPLGAALWLLAGSGRSDVRGSWLSYHMPAHSSLDGTLLAQALASEHGPTLLNVAPYLMLRPKLAGRSVYLYTWEGEDSLTAEQLQWISGVASITQRTMHDAPPTLALGQFRRLTPQEARAVYWFTPHLPVSQQLSVIDLNDSIWICEGCE